MLKGLAVLFICSAVVLILSQVDCKDVTGTEFDEG